MVSPVPALQDAERRTSYTVSNQTGPFNVAFPLFGDSTDTANWLQVWLNGIFQSPSLYTVTSPSGVIGSIALPIVDAQITFLAPITGTLQIVGAERPRRQSQLSENQGVSAHDFNLIVTMVMAEMRERWDQLSRVPQCPPGETMAALPPAASRANQGAGFDANGNLIPLTVVPAVTPVSAAVAPLLSSVSVAVLSALLATPIQAASPRHAQEFGWNFPGTGLNTVATAGNGWMARTGFGSVWVGIVTVPCVQRIDPITGAVIATITTGIAGSNEIRGICMAFGSVWAVDRLGGKVYRINPVTNTIDTTITGFTAPGGGAQGPFGICADATNIYVTTTLTGASTIDKINPALVVGGTVTKAACLVASLNLGCDDTHVPSWDGDASIWVPCLSAAAQIFQVNAAAMTLTAAKATAAGGAWGTFSNGILLFFTELSNDTFAYFPIKGGSGTRFSLPASSGAADIAQWNEELYIALSTLGGVGNVGVYDARYFTQKGLIAAAGTHASSLTFYGGDLWNVDSQSQRLQRTRISHRWT